MDGVTRIGVSLEPDLLDEFDGSISQKGYVSRSEAIRDLIRDSLAEKEWKDDSRAMAGVLVFVYDSGYEGVHDRLRDISTKWDSEIVGSLRVSLEGRKVMETVTVTGAMRNLKNLSNELISVKGVLRGRITWHPPPPGTCTI